MGQYYMVLLEKDGERKILDRSVDGEYTAAKLMEHSWWKNPFVGTVCKMLLNNPTKRNYPKKHRYNNSYLSYNLKYHCS